MNRKIKKILAALLVTLFATYYCESTLFIHTHRFSWGTVTHSHPFDSDSQHSHSETACLTIATLSTIIAVAAVAIAVAAATCPLIAVVAPRVKSRRTGAELTVLSLRAPPVVA